MTISIRILNEALKNHDSSLLIQRISGVGDQKADMGRQLKTLIRTVYIPYTIMMMSDAQQARRIPLPTNTRRYCRRIAALVKLRDA